MMVRSLVLGTALIAGAYGCSGSSTDDGSVHCKTTLAYETGPKPGYSSPGVGQLLLEGNFFVGESVVLYYNTGVVTGNQSATVTTGNTTLSYGGLPSGTYNFRPYLRCPATDYEPHTDVVFTIK